ncbi:hypothetical protein HG531_004351 [Fusarium graminearum]|nr:hypothetical protein HG531_004351 [Fusarium graminearum]
MDFSLIEQQYRSEWINITETYAEAGVGGVKRMGYDAERPLSARNVYLSSRPSALQKVELLLLLTSNLLPLPLNRPVNLSLAHALVSVHKQLLLLLAPLQVEWRLALRHKLLFLLAVLLEQVLLLLSAHIGLLARLHGLQLALKVLLLVKVLGLFDLHAQVGHLLVAVLVQEGVGFAGLFFVDTAD